MFYVAMVVWMRMLPQAHIFKCSVPIGGTVWEGLRGVPLLEEVWHWRRRSFEKPAPLPKLRTQARTCESRCKFSVTASVPHQPPCSLTWWPSTHPLSCKLPVNSLLYKHPLSWGLITAMGELPRQLHIVIYLRVEKGKAHVIVLVEKLGDNWPTLILSFYHTDLEEQTQASRLSGRSLYLLSHLAHGFGRGYMSLY